MQRAIQVKRITVGTTFRLVGIGILFSMVPYSILLGIFNLFGLATLEWNGQPLTGIHGLIASPFIGLLFTLIATIFAGSFMSFGIWFFSKFGSFSIDYIPVESKK